MIETWEFRAAMARLGAAVNIIVTDGPAGRHGMTASAVCSVSDDPASLLLCINKSARMHDVLKGNGRLTVNVLAGGQAGLSGAFADKTLDMDARFAAADWIMSDHGVPALTGALAAFGCAVASVVEMGSHSIFLCEVQHLMIGEEKSGLVYFARQYHALPMRDAA
ncbi:flavin reductase family protein [Sphingobium cupriresistens]|uniref:FMN reductase n=1 Tax=Sphingobium cupriresistens LL01 TaxID=1420583 RepID=A0A0J7XK98_9SPHN|nr:flavin reductase [Sphingobium cupriresistens]KMS52079.1 FMN reductase [Sphingobium cupriresistens LL01]